MFVLQSLCACWTASAKARAKTEFGHKRRVHSTSIVTFIQGYNLYAAVRKLFEKILSAVRYRVLRLCSEIQNRISASNLAFSSSCDCKPKMSFDYLNFCYPREVSFSFTDLQDNTIERKIRLGNFWLRKKT